MNVNWKPQKFVKEFVSQDAQDDMVLMMIILMKEGM